MINIRQFVEAIHRAVSEASGVMEERNRQLLDHYFERRQQPDGRECLYARTVSMTMPDIDEEGNAVERIVEVPLVSLVPIPSSRIKKATFSADFRLSIKDDELCLSFPDEKLFHHKSTQGHLELVISPDEPVEGLQHLIDSYTELLKKQL